MKKKFVLSALPLLVALVFKEDDESSVIGGGDGNAATGIDELIPC